MKKTLLAAVSVFGVAHTVSCTVVNCNDPNANPALCHNTSGGTTGGSEEEGVVCPRHCWERGSQGLVYPMAAGPLNENFVSIPGITNQCWDGSGFIDLSGPYNGIPTEYCPPLQSQSEAVRAVIDGNATQPQQTVYETVVDQMAAVAHADCVETFVALGCVEDTTGPGQFGANQVCEWWLENPLREQMYAESPTPFYTGVNEFVEAEGYICDFDNDLTHEEGLDSSGGGQGNVFGDLSLVGCSGVCDCNYPEEIFDNISQQFQTIIDDGVMLEQEFVQVGGLTRERYRLHLPPSTDSEELFEAFGLRDGDIITEVNGTPLVSTNLGPIIGEMSEIESSDGANWRIRRNSIRNSIYCEADEWAGN